MNDEGEEGKEKPCAPSGAITFHQFQCSERRKKHHGDAEATEGIPDFLQLQ
jgi:hypothetical protein